MIMVLVMIMIITIARMINDKGNCSEKDNNN